MFLEAFDIIGSYGNVYKLLIVQKRVKTRKIVFVCVKSVGRYTFFVLQIVVKQLEKSVFLHISSELLNNRKNR